MVYCTLTATLGGQPMHQRRAVAVDGGLSGKEQSGSGSNGVLLFCFFVFLKRDLSVEKSRAQLGSAVLFVLF